MDVILILVDKNVGSVGHTCQYVQQNQTKYKSKGCWGQTRKNKRSESKKKRWYLMTPLCNVRRI